MYERLNIHHRGVLHEYPDMANCTMPLYHDYFQTAYRVRKRLTSGAPAAVNAGGPGRASGWHHYTAGCNQSAGCRAAARRGGPHSLI